MTKREKYQFTYEAIESEIKRLEKKLADRIVSEAYNLNTVSFNTAGVLIEVGRLKALREIIFN